MTTGGFPGAAPRAALAWAAALAGAVVLVCAPAGEAGAVWRAAAVLVAVLGLWATQALPEYLTAAIFFLLAVTVADAPPAVAFSGFHSAGAWMIFGGLVLGHCVQETGLGARLAARFTRGLPQSYLGILAGAVAVSALMGFLVPSNTGRIVILIPIFLALADRLGFPPGSNGRAGLALAVGAGSLYPSLAVLPAAVPNLILAGAAETLHGVRVTYGDYLLMHYPAVGLVSLAVLPPILRFLLPDRPGRRPAPAAAAPMAREEAVLAAVLAAALALWITDFAHGVAPAWVALAAAVLCLMPRIGAAPPEAMVTRVNLAPWFFVAAVIGAGAVVAHSGLGPALAGALFELAPLAPGRDAANLATICAIGAVMNLIATVPGQPAIMTGLAPGIAEGTGWPLATAVHVQVVTWAMTVFPYQLPPLIVAIRLAGVDARHLIRLQAAMFGAAWLAMLPLLYLWWRTLGMFG